VAAGRSAAGLASTPSRRPARSEQATVEVGVAVAMCAVLTAGWSVVSTSILPVRVDRQVSVGRRSSAGPPVPADQRVWACLQVRAAPGLAAKLGNQPLFE
jgi:hypothetical protein